MPREAFPRGASRVVQEAIARRRGLPGASSRSAGRARLDARSVRRRTGRCGRSTPRPTSSISRRGRRASSAPRRRCSSAAAAARSRRARSPARRRAGATPEEDARARGRRCSPTRRSGPSTSCSWTSSRNDLGRVCRDRERRGRALRRRSRSSRTSSTSSRRSGARSRRDAPRRDALAACFPAGTLTGAPKIRAMELIDGLEAAAAASTAAPSATSTPPATATSRSRSGRPSSRTASAGSRPAPGSSRTRCPRRSTREAESKAAALFRAIDLARDWFRIRRQVRRHDLRRRQLRLVHLQPRAGAREARPATSRSRATTDSIRTRSSRRRPARDRDLAGTRAGPKHAGRSMAMIAEAESARRFRCSASASATRRSPPSTAGRSSAHRRRATARALGRRTTARRLFRGPAEPVLGRAIPFARRARGRAARTSCRVTARSDDGLVMALAHRSPARLRRAVSSRVRPDAGRGAAPRELPRHGGRDDPDVAEALQSRRGAPAAVARARRGDVRRPHGRQGDGGAEGRAPARHRDARRDVRRDRRRGRGAARAACAASQTRAVAAARHVRAGRARPRPLQRLDRGGDRRGGRRRRRREARQSLDLLARGLGGRPRGERRRGRARAGGGRARCSTRSGSSFSSRRRFHPGDEGARHRAARARHPDDLQRARAARESGRARRGS